MIIELKENQLVESWQEIGETINKNGDGKNRTGKQCRERYINHLKMEIKKEAWGLEESIELFELYKVYGSHWTQISK